MRPIQHDEAKVLRALLQLADDDGTHRRAQLVRVLTLWESEETSESAHLAARVSRAHARVVMVEYARLPLLVRAG